MKEYRGNERKIIVSDGVSYQILDYAPLGDSGMHYVRNVKGEISGFLYMNGETTKHDTYFKDVKAMRKYCQKMRDYENSKET